jgi:hypothetical protein
MQSLLLSLPLSSSVWSAAGSASLASLSDAAAAAAAVVVVLVVLLRLLTLPLLLSMSSMSMPRKLSYLPITATPCSDRATLHRSYCEYHDIML